MIVGRQELARIRQRFGCIAQAGCQWRMLPKELPPFTTVQGNRRLGPGLRGDHRQRRSLDLHCQRQTTFATPDTRLINHADSQSYSEFRWIGDPTAVSSHGAECAQGCAIAPKVLESKNDEGYSRKPRKARRAIGIGELSFTRAARIGSTTLRLAIRGTTRGG